MVTRSRWVKIQVDEARIRDHLGELVRGRWKRRRTPCWMLRQTSSAALSAPRLVRNWPAAMSGPCRPAPAKRTSRFHSCAAKPLRRQSSTGTAAARVRSRKRRVEDSTEALGGTRVAARFALSAIVDQIEALARQIGRLEGEIVAEAKRDKDMRRLTTIPGVGAITAASIKALVPIPLGIRPLPLHG